MNDDNIITDLKRFITATVSHYTADLASKDDLKKLETKLETKIDNVQTSINESVITFTQAVDDQVQDHEIRLKGLEPKFAYYKLPAAGELIKISLTSSNMICHNDIA